jgi:hypothetical protein
MVENIALQQYPSIIISCSNNMAIIQDTPKMGKDRTFVLVCSWGIGFVEFAKKVVGEWGYETVKWLVPYPCAVSFSVPGDKPYRIEVRQVGRFEEQYQGNKDDWVRVDR